MRRQRGGFRTKAEARAILDDELRKARLGPLYRPNATLNELVAAFLDQYQGAPASNEWLRHYLAKATATFGTVPIVELDALAIARWRAGLPETTRHGEHRALRQVLGAAVKWQWIERNVATLISNPQHARLEFTRSSPGRRSRPSPPSSARCSARWRPSRWARACARRRPSAPTGPTSTWTLACSRCGTRSPRALKTYAKTARSRRRVPLRAKVIASLETLP